MTSDGDKDSSSPNVDSEENVLRININFFLLLFASETGFQGYQFGLELLFLLPPPLTDWDPVSV